MFMETRSDKRADFGPAAIVDDSLRQFADEIDPPVLKIGQGDFTHEWPKPKCSCGTDLPTGYRLFCDKCVDRMSMGGHLFRDADNKLRVGEPDGSLLRGLAWGFTFSAVLWAAIFLLIRWLL